MEIKDMMRDDIERRSLEIESELQKDDADVDALEKEVEELEKRKIELKEEKEELEAEIKEVEATATVVESIESEEVRKTMEIKELRNTKQYINAYASYVKSEYKDDAELRKVLTENGVAQAGENDTTYPVPVFIETKIRTAWENDEIMRRVRKTFFKGNLKIGFEISGTDAVIHLEGAPAIDEEKLVLGTVTLIPQSIKKFIHISDEQYDMGGEEFLNYIYDELTYRIVKKAGAVVIASIMANPAVSGDDAPAVAQLTQELNAGTIVTAEAMLGEVDEVVAIMSRGTWGALRALQLSSGSNVGDVFDGKAVVFVAEEILPSYANAQANKTYMIVGDLAGVTANFPNGEEVKFKFDDLTEAEADLIKITGRMYAGIGVTSPNFFTQVKKPA